MDKKIIKNYVNFMISSNLKKTKFILFIVFIVTTDIIIILANNSGQNTNCWNGMFSMLVNRNMYILYFLGMYIFLLNIFAKDKNFFIIRLKDKINWLIYKEFIIFLLAISYTLLFFLSLIFISILILGYDNGWSSYTLQGLDMCTSFYNNLTPFKALILYVVRFFLVTVLLGNFDMMLQSVGKIIQEKKRYSVIFVYLLINLVFNLGNMGVLKFLDISNDYVHLYNVDSHYLKFLFFNNIYIIFITIFEMYISRQFIKGVEFT